MTAIAKWMREVQDDADGASPDWEGVVPKCSETACKHYDGKRCRILGNRPDLICEPVVESMGNFLAENAQ